MWQSELLALILPRLRIVRGPNARGEHVAWCPFHADGQGKPPHTPNFNISERGWFCHVCDRGGGLRALAEELEVELPPDSKAHRTARVVRWYDYRDEHGRLLFQVGRKQPKGFTQRCPDTNGGWVYTLNGTRPVLYRLPELIAKPEDTVYLVEGEKDADRLRSLGLTATTNPRGAEKWRTEYSEFLRGRDVVILPDNDEKGQKHARQVSASLARVAARSVRTLNLPGLPAKGDVSDWLDAGHTVEEMRGLLEGDGATEPAAPAAILDESPDDPHRLARVFVTQKCSDGEGRLTLRQWRHQWWQWAGTHYQVLDKDELRAILSAHIKAELDRWALTKSAAKPPRKVTHQLVTNVMQALSGLALVPYDVEQPNWLGDPPGQGCCLSMSNGLIDVERLLAGTETYRIRHTPQWFSPHHLPYDFDPGADCPQWLRFLDEVLEGDQQRINLLQEWFGYCLLPDTSRQKFLVLEGEGANGKSVVCGILADLLGRQNVSHVPLERFGDRFQLTMTLGKLANIASEVGDLDKAAEGVLKAFTAGDRMGFDRKGIAGVEAFPTARLILATNNRPRFSDQSSGLWRRMLLIPFRITIPENRQDPQLPSRLRAELPGIFCWAIAGLHRLRRNGRFTESELGKEALEEYRVENNPARLFLTEHGWDDPDGIVACGSLYGTYKTWCEANGYHELGERMFGKEVVRVFPGVKRTKKGTRERREYRYEGMVVSQASQVSYVPYPGKHERER